MKARSEATRDVHSGLLSMLGSKTTLAVVRELSLGILGRGEGALKGIGVSGSGYNEVPALGMLNVWVYICTRVGAFCLFVLSNLSTTCACITGVS